MSFIEAIYEKAKANRKRVAVPECTNSSMMRAAVRAAADGLADVTFVGDAEVCRQVAQDNDIDLSGVAIASTADEEYKADLLERFVKLPRRGFSPKSVSKRIENPLYMALLMEAVGDVDCTFGGLDTTTSEFVMATQGILGLAPNVVVPSGMLIMEVDNYEGAQGNIFGMADGAVNTEPTADHLSAIALASCETFTALTGDEARCAMLSYSTDGSGNTPSAQKVREGAAKARELRPDLKIDGEFQADAAIVERVAMKKIKRESEVAGRANVLVFPDAGAANIATKLIQQFAPGQSFGPIYQGFAQPVLDCSRGDTEERIYSNFAFCSVMAQA